MQTASTASRAFVNSIAFAIGNVNAGDRAAATEFLRIANGQPVSCAARYEGRKLVGRICKVAEARKDFRTYVIREQLATSIAACRSSYPA